VADYFVDSGTGSDSDNGTTMDLAWATLEHAVESGGLSAGDFVWVRPNHAETPVSDVLFVYDGHDGSPISLVGWPFPAFSITSATWTNGSTTVDLVLPASITRVGHCGRYVTAPDGEVYTITYVTDSNTFTIDREYAGATVTLLNGASSIQADEDYTQAQAIDDSAWTIKKTDWNADNPDRGCVDFNDGAYSMSIYYDDYHVIKNLELKDSTDSYGIIRSAKTVATSFVGCLFKQSAANQKMITAQSTYNYFERCIIEGSGAGSSQTGVVAGSGGLVHFKNCAIYNCGSYGIEIAGEFFFENLNIGIEQANGNDDLILNPGAGYGRDLKLGGTNGYVDFSYGAFGRLSVENYQKVLGDHRVLYSSGYWERKAVSGETPNKKVSDYVVKITPNVNFSEYIPEWTAPVLVHEIEADTSSKTYKYWIYNDSGITLNSGDPKANIWLKAEYIKTYDDTSEYTVVELFSTQQDIADAADADDWDFLEVTLTPAVAGKVRLSLYYTKYLAATNVIIDPSLVIA